MPTCMSCGSFYCRDETADSGELHVGESQADGDSAVLNLNWPSTVEFANPGEVKDPGIRDTLKLLGTMLEARDQQRQLQDPTRGTLELSTIESNVGPPDGVDAGISSSSERVGKGQQERPDDTSIQTQCVVYDPLTGADEIRLLHLSPSNGADDQVLHGTLECTRLILRPDYTALSYTWADADGNRRRNDRIFLGDAWTPLPITSNCAAALRRLRSRDETRVLWVDSICINQDTTGEKSHQVGLMRDIYSRAASVTIFLGDDKEAADARLLKETSERLFWSGKQGDVTWAALHDHVAVRALFDREYWSRIWVIQEVLLSKEAVVVLGDTSISLSSLLKARLVEPDGSDREFGVPSWLRLRYLLPIGDFRGLSSLLSETSRCLASDPKDTVFALLGLVQGNHLEGLVADYSKSFTEIQVGIAAYFIARHGQGDILKQAAHIYDGHEYLLRPGSPSWVPSSSWQPSMARSDEHFELNFSHYLGILCQKDLKTKAYGWSKKLQCYDILRPNDACHTSLKSQRGNSPQFRVFQGSGALLVEAHPLLCIGSDLLTRAFKSFHHGVYSYFMKSGVRSVTWGIYAMRDEMDDPESSVFISSGDWIVEVPNCDEFLVLRPIESLPGAFYISSICGLVITVAWNNVSDDDEVPRTTYKDEELISRLIIFDQNQLLFLVSWDLFAADIDSLHPSSNTVNPAGVEVSAPLSSVDIRRYTEWADHITSCPEAVMEPAGMEEVLKNVSTYLDRWQDPDLWDRIFSELEAVSWVKALQDLIEVRKGFWPEALWPEPSVPEDHAAEIINNRSSPPLGMLNMATNRLKDLILLLEGRVTVLPPAITTHAFGPLFEALDEAHASSAAEVVFKAYELEIERSLKELESYLKFMQDSLLTCFVVRNKFMQRQVLTQLYRRDKIREFLIY
ncbi:hypothetical protein Daus18300_005038 [Diaporthe australafricana]|uniref:Heterokaryon incompatibility domain-containing protein n=1 Tax=Diaporthe australafricana TaxID=127596 RepID=A0ABR3X4U2_9PEZI